MRSIKSLLVKCFDRQQTKFLALVLFVAFAFMIGGSSHPELAFHSVVRGIAVLAICLALSLESWALIKARCGAILAAIACFAVIMLLQLLPLPAIIWRNLPGHQAVIDIMEAAGQGGHWRPMTIAASATWNALLALLVPVATLFLLSIQNVKRQSGFIMAVVFIALAGMIYGFAQVALGGQKALYLFEIANFGSATGFFANRNHHAAFLVCTMPLAMFLALRASEPGRDKRMSLVWIGVGLSFAVGAAATGSRQGLVVATLMCLGLAWLGMRHEPLCKNLNGLLATSIKRQLGRLEMMLGGALLLGFLGAAYLLLGSANESSLERLIASDHQAEQRWLSIPIYAQIVADFFPFGTGMGTFEFIFRQYEDRAILGPTYMNEAHNDWFQLLIEGGVPCALIMIVIAGRAVKNWSVLRRQMLSQTDIYADLRICAAFGIGALLIFSVIDFPARTPAMMALSAILTFFAFGRTQTGNDVTIKGQAA